MLNVQSLTQRTFAQIVVFALLLLNSTLAFAQNQVNGIVTDKTGEPLIGVNVVEKGTTNGVITDFNGQFTLNVAQGKTLVFSYGLHYPGNYSKRIFFEDYYGRRF